MDPESLKNDGDEHHFEVHRVIHLNNEDFAGSLLDPETGELHPAVVQELMQAMASIAGEIAADIDPEELDLDQDASPEDVERMVQTSLVRVLSESMGDIAKHIDVAERMEAADQLETAVEGSGYADARELLKQFGAK